MTGGKLLNGRVGHTHDKTVDCSDEKKKSIIPSLPVEIIFSILVWLPADILFNSMRYVCRQWYNIVCDPIFIQEQLIHSSDGLFIKPKGSESTHANYLEVGKMNATTRSTKLGYPFQSWVHATCNGLLLFTEVHKRIVHGNQVTNDQALCVANPLTKQRVTLPPPAPSCLPGDFYYSFAYSHLTREHKVVFASRSHWSQFFEWMVITVGKDRAWRLIDSKKLSDHGRRYTPYTKLSTGGFLYLIYHKHTSVVALDVESETFCELPGPKVPQVENSDFVSYLVRGTYLSCTVQLEPRTLFNVWELFDPMSGGWRKLYTIDFEVQKFKLSGMLKARFSFKPKAWLKNGEVVVFCVWHDSGPFIVHNVKTGATFLTGSRCLDLWFSDSCGFAWSLVSLAPR